MHVCVCVYVCVLASNLSLLEELTTCKSKKVSIIIIMRVYYERACYCERVSHSVCVCCTVYVCVCACVSVALYARASECA